jgi:hypothetical protein
MRFRTLLSTLGRRATLGALAGALGLGAAACDNDVDITDPNAPSSQTFFASAADAEAAVTATYNTLLRLGTGQRWWAFAHDMRSDVGTSTSPWAELQAFVKLQFPSGYDFEVNRELWNHSYELISRANLVTANVPNIQMNAADRGRLVGEAKFLRAMTYFNLISLYGGQIPLVLEPATPTDRPASSDSATVFAQIEKDLTDAAAAMPRQLLSASNGRATAGSAQGMLGKVQLQQRKWQQAAATLLPVVNGQYGAYDLVADYATLFRQEGNNSRESLFEVQMGNVDTCGQGLCGNNVSKMVGPCGPGYCDGLPTRWYFTQFFTDSTAAGPRRPAPRGDAVLLPRRHDARLRPHLALVARQHAQPPREYQDTTRLFFKKYGEYYIGSIDQNWESQINPKVLRFADVLLMYAEALNEQGQSGAAAPFVNRCAPAAGLRPISAGLSQAQMRAAILKERALELGLEGQRWRDLGRQNLFAQLPTCARATRTSTPSSRPVRGCSPSRSAS